MMFTVNFRRSLKKTPCFVPIRTAKEVGVSCRRYDHYHENAPQPIGHETKQDDNDNDIAATAYYTVSFW